LADNDELETVVTRWLIAQCVDCCKQGMEKLNPW